MSKSKVDNDNFPGPGSYYKKNKPFSENKKQR